MGCGSSQTEGVENKKESNQTSEKNSNTEKQKLYNRGNHLIKQKKFKQADKLFDRAIEIDPEFVDAYYSKGIVCLELDQLQDADKYFNLVLEKQPDHVLSLNELGSMKIREKQFNEALAYLERAYSIQKDFSEVNYGLGYVLSKLSRKEEAIQYYDQAILADNKQKQYYVNKSATLTELKRFDEAMKCIEEALKLDPQYLDALVTKGFALKQSKQFDKLIELSDQILIIDANNKIGQFYKKQAEKELSIQQEPKQEPESLNSTLLIPTEENLELLIQQAQKLKSDKKLSQSLQIVNNILNKNPLNLQGLQLKALILIDLKQYQNALDYCDLALAQVPKDLQMLKEKALILEHLNRLEEALQCHNQIIDEEANFAKSEKRANLLIKLGKAQEASEIFESLSQQTKNQSDPQIFLIRGKLYQAQNKIDQAINCLQEGAERFPKNQEILMSLGMQYQIKEMYKEAVQTYNLILEFDKNNEACFYQKGLSHYKLKQYTQALETFLKIRNPHFNDQIYYYIGDCFYQTKDLKESIKFLTGYLQFGNEFMEEAQFILGDIYFQQLRFDEACESYQNCLKLNPKNAAAHFKLATVHKADKQLEEAKKNFEQAYLLEQTNEEYKQQYETFLNQEIQLNEYRNSLLFTLVTFIGCCQLNQKSSDFEAKLNEKYIGLLLLLEKNLKKRFNSIENHFAQLKDLISISYDMKYTVIYDTLFPIMQFWYAQQICKKKRSDFDFVSIIVSTVKFLITENIDKIYNLIKSDKSLKNKYCMEFAEKTKHEDYQKRSGQLGLIDGIKILGFLLKYQKDYAKHTLNFQEFLSSKYLLDEIQIFHDSYYQQEV